MAFRTILIEKATRINLDLNNIVIYYQEDKYWVNLDEIMAIIIDDPRCLVSLKLLTELCEKGITTIFTNASHMPVGCLNTLQNHSRASKNLIKQIQWDQNAKKYLWTEIVKNKITLQIETLKKWEKTFKVDIMNNYYKTIELADSTNREGLASRTYFKELFGSDFKRFNEDIINYCLNFVYQIIRSKISQEIVSLGYNSSLGIFHRSEYNFYNLSDDFIEPYRPIIDHFVYYLLLINNESYLNSELKLNLVGILNERISFNNCSYKLHQSIPLYLQGMFNFLESGDIEMIKFPHLL